MEEISWNVELDVRRCLLLLLRLVRLFLFFLLLYFIPLSFLSLILRFSGLFVASIPPSIDAKRKSEGGEGQGEENDVEKSESDGWEYPLKPVRSITAPLHCTKNENEPTSPSAVSYRRIEPRDSFFIYLYIYSYLLANMLLC